MDTLFILKCGFAEIMDLSIPTPGGGGGGGGGGYSPIWAIRGCAAG